MLQMSSYNNFEEKNAESSFGTLFTEQDNFRSTQQHIDVEQVSGFNVIFKTVNCT